MAVHFMTDAAQALLTAFDKAIAAAPASGSITTWEKTPTSLYTHKANDWKKKAFFKPSIETDRLRFNIIKPENAVVDTLVYSYYHGHLIETFIKHFDQSFSWARASAKPQTNDKVK